MLDVYGLLMPTQVGVSGRGNQPEVHGMRRNKNMVIKLKSNKFHCAKKCSSKLACCVNARIHFWNIHLIFECLSQATGMIRGLRWLLPCLLKVVFVRGLTLVPQIDLLIFFFSNTSYSPISWTPGWRVLCLPPWLRPWSHLSRGLWSRTVALCNLPAWSPLTPFVCQ